MSPGGKNHLVRRRGSAIGKTEKIVVSPRFGGKVGIFLEQREVAFLSPSNICENLNFSTVHLKNSNFSQILLGDKYATYLCSKTISILMSVGSWSFSSIQWNGHYLYPC